MILLYEQCMYRFSELLADDLKYCKYQLEINRFPNGEFNFCRVNFNDNVLIIFPNSGDINFNLMKYIIFLKNIDCSKNVYIFMPYIPYSRQNTSQAFQFVISEMKTLNVKKIITIDIHKYDNDEFIINILPHELAGNKYNGIDVTVAPDIGAMNRARHFANYLKTELVIIDKVTLNVLNADKIKNKNCLIVDDIKDTGKTIQLATDLLTQNEARNIKVCVSSDIRNNLEDYHIEIGQCFHDINP